MTEKCGKTRYKKKAHGVESEGAVDLALREVGREGDLHGAALVGQQRHRLALQHAEAVALARRVVDVEAADRDRKRALVARRESPLTKKNRTTSSFPWRRRAAIRFRRCGTVPGEGPRRSEGGFTLTVTEGWR